MSFLTWLRNRNQAAAVKRPSGHESHRKRATFRPCLEALESRDVPSTLTVTNNLDSGAGSLRYEIDAAHAGDTIAFVPSLNGQTITIARQLEISTSLTIKGPGAGQLTVSGAGSYQHSRVFQIDANVNVTLTGLTISDGGGISDPTAFDRALWDDYGGGILNLG